MIINHDKTTYVMSTGEIEMEMQYTGEEAAADPTLPDGRG
jgi:hypothetical protein